MPRIYWLTIAFTLLLSGCSNAPKQPQPAQLTPLQSADLATILAAEMALQRGQNQQASELFLTSANNTKNAELAKRATYAAQLSNQIDTYKRSSQLWHHLQPEAVLAQQHLAQSLYHNNEIDLAIDILQSLIQQQPDYLPAPALLAEIFLSHKHYQACHELLLPYTRIGRPDRLLGSLHIQALSQLEDYNQALELTYKLINQHQEDTGLLLTAALLNTEVALPAKAHTHLQQAYNLEPDNPQINFYLAESFLAAGQTQHAIKHYRLTHSGPNLLKAIVSLLELDPPAAADQADYFAQLRQQHPQVSAQIYLLQADYLKSLDSLEAAYQVYAHAVAAHPNNTDILYAQAMLGAYLRDWPVMEQALLTIIALDAEHAHALNALGYTYADHNTQLNKAEEYISKALQLRPDDPAIMDSMGWLNYRQGHYRIARDYLQKAFAILPDAEIAAHLGVVEWALGNVQEAHRVWQSILQDDPDNALIKQAILDAQEEFPSEN